MDAKLFIVVKLLIFLLCSNCVRAASRASDIAITSDDSKCDRFYCDFAPIHSFPILADGIVICGSITCNLGADMCVVQKQSTPDNKNVIRKSSCMCRNGILILLE